MIFRHQSNESSQGPAAKKMAVAKLRSKVEPLLKKEGLEWADAAPAVERMDDKEVMAVAQDPEGFLKRILESAGPA